MNERTRAVFVVGAGRSGTSAMTRGLAAMGVELGDHLKPATRKNPTGFFEDEDLLRVGKNARSTLGLNAASVSLIDDGAWADPALERHYDEAVSIIEQRFGTTPLWGFKYAQTLRLLPFWLEVLRRAKVDTSWLIASRNPLSVARSRAKLDARRGVQEKSDLEWLVNVVPYLRLILERPCVVVDFDLLLADPIGQLERVAHTLDIPLDSGARKGVQSYADTFLRDGMRHTSFDPAELAEDARVNPLTARAFGWLHALSTDRIEKSDREFRADWEQIERELKAQAPALRYIDRLFADARERERRGLRGLSLRLVGRLKRVHWIASSLGALKLRRDTSRSRGARAGEPLP